MQFDNIITVKNKEINLTEVKKLRGFNFWKAIGEPRYICSPMVAQSELAFRLLIQEYGCDLAYTPMINSNIWQLIRKNKEKRGRVFKTCPKEKMVVAQIAGNDPQELLDVAKSLQDEFPNIVAIDINFGCPQGIAKRGGYGSYLLPDTKLVVNIVKTLSEGLSIPFFVKMRILDDEAKTLYLAQQFQEAGASALCVHGRTKEEKAINQKHANWEIIRKIKEQLTIPVISNGGISDYEDIERCFEKTNADAVMSAEGLLEYPALFTKNPNIDLDIIVKQYLEIANLHESKPEHKELKAHLFKWFHQSIIADKQVAIKLGKCKTYQDHYDVAMEIIESRKNWPSEKKRGWYFRWWKAGYTRINGVITPNQPVKMFDNEYAKQMEKQQQQQKQNQNNEQQIQIEQSSQINEQQQRKQEVEEQKPQQQQKDEKQEQQQLQN